MKICLINKFLYPKGGDAVSTITTGKLLAEHGHEVVLWGMDHPNNPRYPFAEDFVPYIDFDGLSGFRSKLVASINILYSREARKKIDTFLDKTRPNIVHLHNFAHQISPSILDSITKRGIPTVMTMHDYKLICPVYTLLSAGKRCERCAGKRFYKCLVHKCSKGSRINSLINTLEMYLHHSLLHIYDKVNLFISPSIFLMEKAREMGLGGRIVYLPNFVELEKFQPDYNREEDSIVYFGRLSTEKGLPTLIDAVKGIDVKLKIMGDGPLRSELERKLEEEGIKNVEFLGYRTGENLQAEIRRSMFVVVPSEWYENNPFSIIEAFALGKPVIGALIGGIPELVKDGETGLTFESGNVNDLREKIIELLKQKERLPELGVKARKFVENNLDAEKFYNNLISLYKSVIS